MIHAARPKIYAYPIIRVDMFQFDKSRIPRQDEFEQFTKVVKVMDNEDAARTEVIRLGKINESKNVHYFYTHSYLG